MTYEAKFANGDKVKLRSVTGDGSFLRGFVDSVIFMRTATMPFYDIALDSGMARVSEDQLEAQTT